MYKSVLREGHDGFLNGGEDEEGQERGERSVKQATGVLRGEYLIREQAFAIP